MLLGVQLRGISGQTQQANVFGYHQSLGPMRTGPVDDHYDKLPGMGERDLRQVLSHTFGIHHRTDSPVHLPLNRAHRTVDIDKLTLVTVVHHRPIRRWSPTTPDSDHAPKPRFVLKHQPHMPALD